MSRRVQLVFFALGTAVLSYLVARIGVGQLWADAVTTGWMIVPIVLLYGVVHACNAQAFRMIMHDEPQRPGFGRTYALMMATSAINFITPVVNAGGEPYRIAALAPELGTGRAMGAVILHTMLRGLSSLLIWLTALVLGLVLLPHTPLTIAVLLGGILGVGTLTALLVSGHRHGVFERVLNRLHRVPGLRRWAGRLEAKRPALAATDLQITDFYHRHPRRFWQALALEYLSRCVFMAEFCLIGAGLGVSVSYLNAFVIGGLEALVTNVLFFVPFDVGTHESITYLMFHQLGYAPGLGLYAALVSRVRDILWIAAGLALIWATGRRRGVDARAEETTPA